MKYQAVLTLLAAGALAGAAGAQQPKLVPATLRSISPAGVVRGRVVTFTLSGLNLAGASRVVFSDPAVTGVVEPGANANQIKVKAEVGSGAQPGIHRVFVQTPLGTTGAVTFAVSHWDEAPEKEPNDTPASAPVVKLPATLVGTLDRVGDSDCFRFEARAGQELVFEVTASQIRSRLNSVLMLLDADGKELERADTTEGRPDAILGYRFSKAGTYALQVRDFENAGGGDVTYRISAGDLPFATSAFPLGLRNGEGEVTLTGFNLGGAQVARVSAPQGGWGVTASVATVPQGRLARPVLLGVGEDPETVEPPGPNDTAERAVRVDTPVTVNGRIDADRGPDVDHYRFRARKGQSMVVEVQARRLGSPLDSVIEVLDAGGKRIERATLRCVAETALTLSDRDSAQTGLRLLAWNEMSVNDFVYIRGEVLQILELPKGPDEDTRFRSVRGQRIGFLDTTPSGQAVNTPVYKVQIHPPGTRFPPNGMPVFRLYYQNDDGGPLYGKDSRVSFTAPEDGEYVVRIGDVRGEASPRHAYRLTIRESRPDFRLSLGQDHPGIPAGSGIPVAVNADRLDGFDGEIEVRLEGLPEGVTATSTTIEPGETSAFLTLTAAPEAKTPPEPVALRLVGRGRTVAGEVSRVAEPGGGRSHLTILPGADLTLRTASRELVLVPGTEQTVEVSITRENGFSGRVPVDLKNLPYGVRVLDVGLNGVLITEGETSRRFTVYCEPWVKPVRRLVYATARTETGSAAPTEVAALPISLQVLPKPAGPSRAASR